MARTLNFNLRDSKSDRPTSILLSFKVKGVRFTWSIGKDRMIHPDLWDTSRRRPITTKGTTPKERNQLKAVIARHEKDNPNLKTDLENITNRIDNVSLDVRKYISQKEAEGESLDFNELREILDAKYTPTKKTPQKPKEEAYKEFVTPFYEYFYNGIARGEILKGTGNRHGERYANETVRTYRDTLKHWKEFEEEYNKRIRWDDLTVGLYDDFLTYCYGNGNTSNYVGKLIKVLKAISKRAYERGYHNNRTPETYKVLKVDVNEVALTAQEVERMRTVDLSSFHPKYELYRDVFLIGCYTALRYSDYSKIKPVNVKYDDAKEDHLDLIQQKTKKRVVIPVRPELKEIMDKYDNKIPRTYRQDVNDAIKEIAKAAGINEVQEYEKVKGGMVVKTQAPKWSRVKTHTARRTGATLMYLSGVQPFEIMKITGHSKEKTLLTYIKVDQDQNAAILKDNVFFKGGLKRVK